MANVRRRRCKCGHSAERHEIEPPYPCYGEEREGCPCRSYQERSVEVDEIFTMLDTLEDMEGREPNFG